MAKKIASHVADTAADDNTTTTLVQSILREGLQAGRHGHADYLLLAMFFLRLAVLREMLQI